MSSPTGLDRLEEMADRIAASGCAVLVPNLFYWGGRAPVVPDVVARLQTEDRAAVQELRPSMAALTPEVVAGDTAAHADDDTSMPPEQIARLEQALDEAGVTSTSEVCAGAHHGFTMGDTPGYDEAAEQRHGDALLGLLDRTVLAGRVTP